MPELLQPVTYHYHYLVKLTNTLGFPAYSKGIIVSGNSFIALEN